jgi:prepilin-type processing-associated H-X9-DG protein
MKQVNLGWQMYMQDYDETWVYRVAGNAIGPGEPCRNRYTCASDRPIFNWYDVVQPYTKSNLIVMCPSSPVDNAPGTYAGIPGLQNLGIGINVRPTWGLCLDPAIVTPHGGSVFRGVSLAAVTKPAQTICMADAGKLWYKPYADRNRVNSPLGLYTHQGRSPFLSPRESIESGGEWGPEDRHTGVCNVGFLDGHVKAMKPEAFYLGWNGIWFRPDRDQVMAGDPNWPR